jgi:outer membrane protein OmpA-like peptidoglycan-associated protein/predicted negative regulator of RcsB-dependent stress response
MKFFNQSLGNMITMKIHNAFYAVILLLFSLLITSCGLWRDFTVYFNTYYNAKTLFDQSEGEILKQKKDLFAFKEDQQKNIQPSNPQNTQQTGNITTQPVVQYYSDLNKVIEKCSKILQYEKSSSYFEDALFMTGKAFFYQGEFPKAQRKFIELAGLGESKYNLENKLWLAKTHLQLRNFDEGLKLIEEVKADAFKAKNDKLYMDASITKIGFLIYRQDYQKAIDECIDYLKVSKDDEINALVSYELGKIYILVNDDKNALDSFNSALNFSPTFDIEFESRFESARLMKKLNKIDESAKAFENLRYQGKFKDKLDRILIELAKIYYQQKQSDKAVIILKDVDTTYKQNQSGGIASLELGEIYEKEYRNYDSSYKYYNKAVHSNALKDITIEADKNSKNLVKYFSLKGEYREFNQQITYSDKPQYFYQDSVDYSLVFRQYQEKINKMIDSIKSNDSQKNSQNQNITFDQVSKIYIEQQENRKTRGSGLRKIEDPPMMLIAKGIYKKPLKLNVSLDSLKTLISQNLYNIGSLFYSELDAPDSAYIYFKKILKEYPKKPVTSQTMFALGTYYETNSDSVKADSMFKYIYNNFEKDPIGLAAGQKLGLIKKDDERLGIKNSDPAEKSYIEAEQLVTDKKYEEAINSFQNIYKNSPKSQYAAKSIYYCGLIYEENLKMYDSAAAAYGLLQSKTYMNSALAKAVNAKYLVYKAEKDRLKSETDKLNKESDQKETPPQQKGSISKENSEPPKSISPELAKDGKPVREDLKDEPIQQNKIDAVKNTSIKKDSINIKLAGKTNLEEQKFASDTVKTKSNLSNKELQMKTVHFGFNKSFLSNKNKRILNAAYKEISVDNNPMIAIHAYTDSLGRDEYNMNLSIKRALAIKKYFVNKGLDQKFITAEGFGKTKPVSPNNNPKGRAENRRGELSAKFQTSLEPDSKPIITKKNQLIDKDVKIKNKAGQDLNQKSGANNQTRPIESNGIEIKQSVTKDLPAKHDSVKILNDESPVPHKESVPNKVKIEKDSTKKFMAPL